MRPPCAGSRSRVRVRGSVAGSRRRGRRTGGLSFWLRGRRASRSARRMPGTPTISRLHGQDRRAADGDRVRCMRRWTSWRPAALWPGGGRRDEWRPVDLHPSGRIRAAGLPHVARLRPLQRVHARRQATPSPAPCRSPRSGRRRVDRMTSWWPTFVGCSKSSAVSWRGLPKSDGRSCGLRAGSTVEGAGRRFMHEHDLQAPQRAGHAHGPNARDGTITTEARRRNVGYGHDGHGDRRRGASLCLRGR